MAKPNFKAMSDDEAKSFIFDHIKKRFTRNGPMIGKLPKDCRDDALNEVFIDLWNNRFNYDPKLSDFTTYAYNRGRGVVKAMLQSYSRLGKIRKRISSQIQTHYHKEESKAENLEFLQSALKILSAEEKNILSMRYMQDVPVNEIAKHFNINPQKIYAIIREAKLKCMNFQWSTE